VEGSSMSRQLLTISSTATRARAMNYVTQAPFGTRVEFRAAKRTLPQNDKLWATLTDIAEQKQHCGRKYTPDTWKCIFMHALNKECQFVTSLDGHEPIPLGFRSSELSKEECSELIEFAIAWGTQNGVRFHDQEAADAA
jgi:hypothetical protein